MEAEEFRRAGYALIDRIVKYREDLAARELPVKAVLKPRQILEALPRHAPEEPESFEAILKDIDSLVFDGVLHWQHPRFFGYFPCGGGLPSVLADIISTGLGVVGLSWESSPALTDIETAMMAWMRDLFGLSSAWSGVIQDTASTSTLVALLCARERSTDLSASRGGLQGQPAPLTVYATGEAHSSVMKAATLAGFGRDNVRLVATDAEFRMQPEALHAAIAADRAAGRLPCAVIATAGTTSTTAIDPLAAIGKIVQRERLWLHVDGALGGAAMIAPQYRALFDGIECADSLVVNAHKWMRVAFDCSLYFVRDVQHLVRVMSTNPSYLRTEVDAEVVNYRDWGIPLGRRFRGLKLWLTLRTLGARALREFILRDCQNAQWLAEQVDINPSWHRIAPVPLQTVCVTHHPPHLEGDALDQHNLHWCRRLNATGYAYLTPAIIGGRWAVRVSVGAELTEQADVAALWRAMQDMAENCVGEMAG